MPYEAKLEIDGNSYTIRECGYKLERNYDDTGKPTSIPRGGVIDLLIETEETAKQGEPTIFISWMVTQKHRKNGKITFKDPTEDADIKVIEFEDAYMVNYEEIFNSIGNSPMTERLKISAKKIVVGDAEHINR